MSRNAIASTPAAIVDANDAEMNTKERYLLSLPGRAKCERTDESDSGRIAIVEKIASIGSMQMIVTQSSVPNRRTEPVNRQGAVFVVD